MQRKILNTKKIRSGFYIQNGLEKLHSIPIIKMKSNVLYSIPYVFAFLLVEAISLMSSNSCSAATSTVLSISKPTLSDTVSPGDTAYVSSNVTYSASDIDSYSMYVNYANGYDSLKLENGTTTLAGAGGKVGSNMRDNTWGFAWGNTSDTNSNMTYYTVPATNTNGTSISTGRLESATLASSANNTLPSTTKKIVFAAKFGSTNANSGHYKTKVDLRMVATPKKVTNPFGIETMQEMTPTICANAKENDTAQLKDTRDNKYYWVTKLADNHCWMTQNLDLDLATNKALTSTDSDVTSNWTPAYSTANTVTSSTILNQADGQRSWSLGNYYLTKPTEWNGCGSNKNSAADCPSQFTSYNTPTTANEDLNAHYILGNHYQWNAATASTGASITAAGQASGSICPKGWRLPTGASTGEFQTLVNTSSIGSDVAKLTSAPYYFARSGMIYQSASILFMGGGDRGLYWANNSSSDGESYYLYFNRTNRVLPSSRGYISETYSGDSELVDPSPIYRSYGASIRCIAKNTSEAQSSSPK